MHVRRNHAAHSSGGLLPAILTGRATKVQCERRGEPLLEDKVKRARGRGLEKMDEHKVTR